VLNQCRNGQDLGCKDLEGHRKREHVDIDHTQEAISQTLKSVGKVEDEQAQEKRKNVLNLASNV
jgi:hypothetical protein